LWYVVVPDRSTVTVLPLASVIVIVEPSIDATVPEMPPDNPPSPPTGRRRRRRRTG